MDDIATLGRRLAEERKRRKLSQEEAAVELGMSRNYVSLLERGVATNPSHAIVERIKEWLGDVRTYQLPHLASQQVVPTTLHIPASAKAGDVVLLFALANWLIAGNPGVTGSALLDTFEDLLTTLDRRIPWDAAETFFDDYLPCRSLAGHMRDLAELLDTASARVLAAERSRGAGGSDAAET